MNARIVFGETRKIPSNFKHVSKQIAQLYCHYIESTSFSIQFQIENFLMNPIIVNAKLVQVAFSIKDEFSVEKLTVILWTSFENSPKMDSTSALNYQLRIFRFFGMLPEKQSNNFYKLWGLVVFVVSGIGLVTCQGISVFYIKSADDLVKELLLLVTTVGSAIKIGVFHLRRRNFINAMKILGNADGRVKDSNHNFTMQTIFKHSRRITIIYSVFYLGSLLSLFLELPFLERDARIWKSTTLIPNEIAQKPYVYYSVLIFEIIGNSLNCVTGLCVDSCGLILINLLCGHIGVLTSYLQKLGVQRRRSNCKTDRLELKECIEHYDLLEK